MVIDEAFIQQVRDQMPELPAQKQSRYESDLGLSLEDAVLLSGDLLLATYFENTLAVCNDSQLASNWIKGDLLANLNRA